MATALRSEEVEGPQSRLFAGPITSVLIRVAACLPGRPPPRSEIENPASAQRAMARLSRSRTAAQAGSSGGRSIAIQS